MESSLINKRIMKKRRQMRVRKKVRGSSFQPRLSVVKTNKNIYLQLIDDDAGLTLAGISTVSKGIRNTENAKKGKSAARLLGLKIAEMGKALQVERVIFDRGSFKYHGIIAEAAEGAREGGLRF
ncbi:50S ribosomal protein L18 [Candidatus Clavichlamydia salmonicola]|uniref:Large ribosomal subunit protein uL18 n=1 Tax=Candidatus Clavichlamydia salmonicola TaxID=469812 RepID=A0A1K0IT46_9CHLA|nr:50S ribosomal protein L18 [Candidatus Clavichlamydia salmonicola]MBF5050761.1 50S ribosomal protein L18 [Candidatus Clavichlamydia salmonicola]SDA08613.1 50S ribosomal protein L18 [Candidatus Clavichlamydia salmonicola]